MRRLLLLLLFLICTAGSAYSQQNLGLSIFVKGAQYPSVGAQYGVTPGMTVRLATHFQGLFDGYIITGAVLGRIQHDDALSTWLGAGYSLSRGLPSLFNDNLTHFPTGMLSASYALSERVAVFGDFVLSVYLEDGILPLQLTMFDTGVGMAIKL